MKNISTNIYEKQKIELEKNIPNEDIKLLKQNRDDSKWYSFLNFSTKSDTIYLKETNDLQGSFDLVIWNRIDTVHFYTPYATKIYIPVENIFSQEDQYKLALITNWDVSRIKEFERNSDTIIILPRLTNYISRIVFKNQKYTIDVFKFRDFVIDLDYYK